MSVSVTDLHPLPLGGVTYRFRSPSVYDPAKARRVLTRQRVRRPALAELRVAALAGIEELARATALEDEGARQREVLEEWYRLLDPVREDDIDEPDPMRRGELLVVREAERQARQTAIYPDVSAIEANLERHWQPYAELLADRNYWDDVSRIEIVRLLLADIDGAPPPRDDEEMMTESAYQAIPAAHRMPLATFAFDLIAPNEAQRKN